MLNRLRLAVAVSSFAITPALAHTGHETTGLTAGFLHPFGGVDHMAAMVAVGLWAAFCGGVRVWVWPVAFVSAMLVGGGLGLWGVAIPFVEPSIAASLIVLGLLIALAFEAPLAIGTALIMFFAIFHGHAHGTEAPAGNTVTYAAGFALATALLHASGISIGLGLQRAVGPIPVRALGAVTAMTGAYLLIK
jgi:urease accessory protein